MPIAEVEDGVRIRLTPLPAADSEGAWVALRLQAERLSGSRASVSAVRARMTDASVIHFATHALAFSTIDRARDSFLALSPDSSSNGLLTVGNLMDDSTLVLHADLVVLSACQTALGMLTDSEGTVGLERAFLAKGARSLLVSLWSVDDVATAELMKRFYSHWLADPDAPSKADALRRAQADLRANPRFAAPAKWAAFDLVGAN
jgi:CHAT domain-containing protein